MTSDHTPERVLVVGGSSGMGLALAGELLAQGTEVTIAGRSPDRLATARHQLTSQNPAAQNPDGRNPDGQHAAGRLRTVVADLGDERDVEQLFEAVGELDHVVTTAADIGGAYQPISTYDIGTARSAIESKLLGPLLLAKHGAPRLAAGGSIVFTSGIAAYRPGPKGAMVAALNGALGSLAAALAVELAPLRVNVISPGWVDTPIWQSVAGDATAATLAAMARRLPAGRIGRTQDIAAAIIALLRNGFITGTVLHADGGHRLV
ncbi:SDR family oxidoreductase [Kribbella sp. NPDC023855]|uniref:SDR family oxidoreductase n=1 Tax=Kribbella sp. NPDC023855 TaxID=3154698 RepID=UPI00340EBB53